jgi:hypothetical protein
MSASPELLRKFHALTNRLDEVLARIVRGVRGDRPWYNYDPLDVVPLFERWRAVRQELVATDPELVDLPAYELPRPSNTSDNDGRGIIERPQIERMRGAMRDAWDILNHPSRQMPQVPVPREVLVTPPHAPAQSVVHNHHYNNSGIANVMGPDGVASGNTNNVQITQRTLNLEDPRIAGELAELRKALAAEADDDAAAIEAGNVASAQKALKAGDEGGFRAAMKQFGAKAWGVAEKLALAWTTIEGRHLLGLPPG